MFDLSGTRVCFAGGGLEDGLEGRPPVWAKEIADGCGFEELVKVRDLFARS